MPTAAVPVESRFWTKVAKSDGCWLWTGGTTRDGYGRISKSGKGAGKLYAHRVAYELLVGPIPPGLTLDHLCRNTSCVRPEHLEPVTMRENLRRGNGFGGINARKTHCKRGHEFTPENTKRQPLGRACRTCINDARRAA